MKITDINGENATAWASNTVFKQFWRTDYNYYENLSHT